MDEKGRVFLGAFTSLKDPSRVKNESWKYRRIESVACRIGETATVKTANESSGNRVVRDSVGVGQDADASPPKEGHVSPRRIREGTIDQERG
ncbi:hypothetical protein KM043_017269 [Ampulex compressa]|nr:hypothetical protein KM043_017269 [Ampulex compressa]